MKEQFTDNEATLILLLRKFDFLRNNGYRIIELVLHGTETYIVYKNFRINQTIYIEWAPRNFLEIRIFRSNLFRNKEVNLNDIYRLYSDKNLSLTLKSMPDVIEYYSTFIKNGLMPIIKGETWLDNIEKKTKLAKLKNIYFAKIFK